MSNSLDNTLRVGTHRADRVGADRHPHRARRPRLRSRHRLPVGARRHPHGHGQPVGHRPRVPADRIRPRSPPKGRPTMSQRYGMTIPFDNVPARRAARVDRGAAPTSATPTCGRRRPTAPTPSPRWRWPRCGRRRCGSATPSCPCYTRGPATLAQCVGSLAQAAPGRFVLGLGTSSDVIVERWNGIPFEEPYKRTRDMVRFLRVALTGEKVTADYDTFAVKGFKLGVVPDRAGADPGRRPARGHAAPRRPRGRRRHHQLAVGRRRVARSRRSCASSARRGRAEKEIVARIFVAPERGRRHGAGHGPLRHRRLPQRAGLRRVPRVARPGRPARRHVEAVEGGRPQGRHGGHPRRGRRRSSSSTARPRQCREHVQRYVDNGVTTPALAILPFPGIDQRQAIRDLAPR